MSHYFNISLLFHIYTGCPLNLFFITLYIKFGYWRQFGIEDKILTLSNVITYGVDKKLILYTFECISINKSC